MTVERITLPADLAEALCAATGVVYLAVEGDEPEHEPGRISLGRRPPAAFTGKCERCGGKRWVHVHSGDYPCPVCGGSGRPRHYVVRLLKVQP